MEARMSEILQTIQTHLRAGDDERVAEYTGRAIREGVPAVAILDGGLLAGMRVVGDQFRAHDIFLPDVLLAARAMYAGLDLIRPLLQKDDVPSRGKVVLGTVRGDLHDIGKNLVAIMLRGAGFEVVDLGSDVSPERFVAAARGEGTVALGMSALLTTTMPAMRDVVDLLKKEGLSGRVKTIVGGAPVTEAFAREIGADAFGYDSGHAVLQLEAVLGEVRP